MRPTKKGLITEGLLQLKRVCDSDVTLLTNCQMNSQNDYSVKIFKATTKQKAVDDLLVKRIGIEKFNALEKASNY